MRVCLPGTPGAIGGPASFRRNLTAGLNDYGIEAVNGYNSDSCDLVLVVGGTRHLAWLRQCKRRGIPIVQRLGAINWAHKAASVTSKVRWLGGIRNYLTRSIRDHFADYVIYQSRFAEEWWRAKHGSPEVPSAVIYNGVNTDLFAPEGESAHESSGISLVSVEGNLGYMQQGLMTPIDTWKRLASRHPETTLVLVGHLDKRLQRLIPDDPLVNYVGAVSHSEIPAYVRGATVFVSGEVNPACPNSVIEALACGTPVVGFSTGALPEVVGESAGICPGYGADPWEREQPDIGALERAVEQVSSEYERYSVAARQHAVERYDVSRMVSQYVGVFEAVVGQPAKRLV